MPNKKQFAPFCYDAIRLRLIQEADLPMMLAWRNRDDVRRWFKHSEPLEFEKHREWFLKYKARDNDFLFIVEDSRTSEPVGQASVYDIDWETAEGEVGRFIAAPEFGGKGYMRQACSALCEFAFSELKINLVFLEVMPANQRAIHLYRSIGFIEKGITAEGLIRMEMPRGSLIRRGAAMDVNQ